MKLSEGHRERLREKFRQNPTALSETESLELMLTYAIPRKDVAPLAIELIARFGSLQAVITAPQEKLIEVTGVGEATATLFQLVHSISVIAPEDQTEMTPTRHSTPSPQLTLFELEPKGGKQTATVQAANKQPIVKQHSIRVFTNDEITNSLQFLPEATRFHTLEAFKHFLNEKLPYNAIKTRLRRTNNIVERFFPGGDLDIPLTYFIGQCSSQNDLKEVVFYHILQAEPIASKVAEELIWPALPIGRIEREQMREFVLRYLPEAGTSSQNNMLRALFYTYDLLGVGSANETTLRFQLRKGTLESFLYILTSEFPRPGIYSFESLYNSPLHRWLLWEREWMRMQLYNLQDFNILSKVSEIDTVRQFTLAVDQPTALRRFFEHPERHNMAIREKSSSGNDSQEG